MEMCRVMEGREWDAAAGVGSLGSEDSKAWLGNSLKRKRLASGGWPRVEVGDGNLVSSKTTRLEIKIRPGTIDNIYNLCKTNYIQQICTKNF